MTVTPSTAGSSPGVAPGSDATVTSISALRGRRSIALCSLSQRPARSCLTACTSLAAREYACFVDDPTTANSASYNCTYTTCTLTSVPEYPILGAVRGMGAAPPVPVGSGGCGSIWMGSAAGGPGCESAALGDERVGNSSSAVVRNLGFCE